MKNNGVGPHGQSNTGGPGVPTASQGTTASIVTVTADSVPDQPHALARARAFAEPLIASENILTHADAVAATIVRQGLGLRWSFMGPFETVDLNTRGGIASHAQKMGPAYERMGAQRGQRDPWVSDLVADVAEQRRRLLPLDLWEQRVQWRDRMLMRLMRQRRDGTESWPPQS